LNDGKERGMNDEEARKIKELQAKENEASKKYVELRHQFDKEQWDGVKQVNDTLQAKYGSELDRLAREHNAANDALRAEQERIKVEEAKPPWPVGTQVFEWLPNRSYEVGNSPSNRRLMQWIASKRTGVVEIVTPESKFPSNLRWRRPRVGDVIVRLPKADGSPSMAFDRFGGYGTKWLPEGVDPNQEKQQ